MVWLPFFIFPYIGNNHPNWLSYFSEGFKPPTSVGFMIFAPPLVAPQNSPFFRKGAESSGSDDCAPERHMLPPLSPGRGEGWIFLLISWTSMRFSGLWKEFQVFHGQDHYHSLSMFSGLWKQVFYACISAISDINDMGNIMDIEASGHGCCGKLRFNHQYGFISIWLISMGIKWENQRR